jgi:pimeloyl-ACP methyl ester carboxylesterase
VPPPCGAATTNYTLSEQMIRDIRTPVLILEGEDDKVFEGQAAALARQLQAPHEHVVLRSADGAGAHCHEGAMYQLHQTVFNFLATTFE